MNLQRPYHTANVPRIQGIGSDWVELSKAVMERLSPGFLRRFLLQSFSQCRVRRDWGDRLALNHGPHILAGASGQERDKPSGCDVIRCLLGQRQEQAEAKIIGWLQQVYQMVGRLKPFGGGGLGGAYLVAGRRKRNA